MSFLSDVSPLSLVACALAAAVFLFLAAIAVRKINNPEKNLSYLALSSALTPLRALKQGPFKYPVTLETSMKYAVRKTKLSDFGDTKFAANYKMVMESATQKKNSYSNLGYLTAQTELKMTMVRRLKLVQYLKEVPEIEKVPLRSPVFVMGLPRTGTTFLHRLLSLDPAVRAPLLWELLAPVPGFVPDKADYSKIDQVMEADRHKRAMYTKKLIQTRKSLGDHALDHIHEIGYDLPEECIISMADEIPVLPQFLYTAYLSITEWFAQMDFKTVVQAYTLHRKVLQLLSWQDGAFPGGVKGLKERRWLLKCPIHLFYTKEIAAAFPDAKLVWTHRHPTSAVPSLCSLLKAFHQVYYEPQGYDRRNLGRSVADLSLNLLQQTPKDIVESRLPCAHVTYERLIEDPISVVRGIYKDLGFVFTDDYERILKEFLEKDTAKRKALKAKRTNGTGGDTLHSYSPEEFLLTNEELSSGAFASYCQAYSVPQPKK